VAKRKSAARHQFDVDPYMLADALSVLLRQEKNELPKEKRHSFRDLREWILNAYGIAFRKRPKYRSKIGSILGSRPRKKPEAKRAATAPKKRVENSKTVVIAPKLEWVKHKATARHLVIEAKEFWVLEYILRNNQVVFAKFTTKLGRMKTLPDFVRRSADAFAEGHFGKYKRVRMADPRQGKLL
jgi:hypothetical protein